MINPVKISCVELLLEIRKWQAASKQCAIGAWLALNSEMPLGFQIRLGKQ